MTDRALMAMHLGAAWISTYGNDVGFSEEIAKCVAKSAVGFADALLAELAKSEPERVANENETAPRLHWQPAGGLGSGTMKARGLSGTTWFCMVEGSQVEAGPGNEPVGKGRFFPSMHEAQAYCEGEDARLIAEKLQAINGGAA